MNGKSGVGAEPCFFSCVNCSGAVNGVGCRAGAEELRTGNCKSEMRGFFPFGYAQGQNDESFA